MVKWDDKHMYNWIGWMRSLLVMRENINDWTTSPKKAYKFPIFMTNNLIISPLVLFAIFLMSIPQTIEWAMANLMAWVNNQMTYENVLDLNKIKGWVVVMVIIFLIPFLIPYLITWGLPGHIKQSRAEKRLQRRVADMERLREHIAQDGRQWRVVSGQELTPRHKKDFKPKKEIKAHSLVKSPFVFISPGVYIRALELDDREGMIDPWGGDNDNYRPMEYNNIGNE